MSLKRTHTCGALRAEHVGQTVTLCGWVHNRRDHGGVIFIDLRDREGLTQVVFKPEHDQAAHDIADAFRAEYVVACRGEVRHRIEGMVNPKMDTGEVEVYVDQVELLNASETPPFEIEDRVDVSAEIRMRHRYLDLRRPQSSQRNLRMFGIDVASRSTRDYSRRPQGYLDDRDSASFPRARPKARATSSFLSRADSRKVSTRSPRHPSSTSSCCMVAGRGEVFSDRQAASATRTCGPTASPSSPSSTSKCRVSSTQGHLAQSVEGILADLLQGCFSHRGAVSCPESAASPTPRPWTEIWGRTSPTCGFGMEIRRPVTDIARGRAASRSSAGDRLRAAAAGARAICAKGERECT